MVIIPIENGKILPNFKRLIESNLLHTRAEDQQENLEPWIQWVSVHTGLTFAQHGVFRLGDIVNYGGDQLFEEIERRGYKVGSMCAMNADNRLNNPAFFIPDPWTSAKPDNSLSSKRLTHAMVQSVNDNAAGKLSFQSIIDFGLMILKLIPLRYFPDLLSKAFWGMTTRWRRAIFLDILLFYCFESMVRSRKPDFATLFLNAGAHIQHHYMHASSVVPKGNYTNPVWHVPEDSDPVLDAYQQYDRLLGKLFSWKNCSFIIATGLSQSPFESPIFFHHLKNHSEFLGCLGLLYHTVEPRMARDFLINFLNDEDRDLFARALRIENVPFFGHIDTRNKSLLVTLDYPYPIAGQIFVDYNDYLSSDYNFADAVVFVAIKNEEHQGKGSLAIDPKLNSANFSSGDHVSRLHDTITRFVPQTSCLTLDSFIVSRLHAFYNHLLTALP